MGITIPFLVIGLTGPMGAGCTSLAGQITRMSSNDQMVKRYYSKRYDSVIAKLKDLTVQIQSRNDENTRLSSYREYSNLLKERAYLDVVREIEPTKCTPISMSSLLMKLTVQCVQGKEFRLWAEKNVKAAKLLEAFHDKWSEVIENYNDKYDQSASITPILSEIDCMFAALQKLRDEIKELDHEIMLRRGRSKNEFEVSFYMQEFGDNLRGTGNAFLSSDSPDGNYLSIIAHEANKYIKFSRHRLTERSNCFIIDAFRNPAEIEFFRRRYEQFFLFSINADFKKRAVRLKKMGSFSKYNELQFDYLFKKLDKRDWGGDLDKKTIHRQNVSRCCEIADIAINNNCNSKNIDEELFNKFMRFYALIAKPGCVPPTKEENLMNLAYSLSLRSTCISRKVGAVITDCEGYVVGMGWNDPGVGQVGCGMLCKDDYINHSDEYFPLNIFEPHMNQESLKEWDDDHSVCFKDYMSKTKIGKKISEIKGIPERYLSEVKKKLSIKRLEYCRALHAEENALLQVAKRGGLGVEGGTIYTTTFPCELCAKKIYQSGLNTIVYTEPYPNSISEDVFLRDGIRKIELVQFEGVKSSSYFRLFKPIYDKKDAQNLNSLHL